MPETKPMMLLEQQIEALLKADAEDFLELLEIVGLDHKTDLRGGDLIHLDLHGANFRQADLRSTDLSSADLRSADLRSANLTEANLVKADFRQADLRRANLTEANLMEADFRQANLRSANLTEANLVKTDFRRANLRSANLTKADLKRTSFAKADLRNANLFGVDLRYCDLEGANLRGVIVQGALVPMEFGVPMTGEGGELRDVGNYFRDRQMDERLTKSQMRKLLALRRSVGEDIGTKAFTQWLKMQGKVKEIEDKNAELIAKELVDLIKKKKVSIPRGGYLIKRSRGRVIVRAAESD